MVASYLSTALLRSLIPLLNFGDTYFFFSFGTFGLNNTTDLLGGYAPGLLIRKWPEGLAQRNQQGDIGIIGSDGKIISINQVLKYEH